MLLGQNKHNKSQRNEFRSITGPKVLNKEIHGQGTHPCTAYIPLRHWQGEHPDKYT